MAANFTTRLEDPREIPQGELALSRAARDADVPIELTRKQRSSAAAFALACVASGLDDKEIYLPLEIDAGHFSRIKKGEAAFPADKLADFCRLVRNTIYPEWLAYQVGCTLVVIQSEAERRAEVEKQRADALAAENRLMRELLRGRAA